MDGHSLKHVRALGTCSPWEDLQECQGSSRDKWNVRIQDPPREIDAFAPLPLSGPFVARCDDCGEGRSYRSEELLRLELNLSDFIPHPLFR